MLNYALPTLRLLQERWRSEVATALTHALEATDAELYDSIFDGLLRLIVAYVPVGMSHDRVTKPTKEQKRALL